MHGKEKTIGQLLDEYVQVGLATAVVFEVADIGATTFEGESSEAIQAKLSALKVIHDKVKFEIRDTNEICFPRMEHVNNKAIGLLEAIAEKLNVQAPAPSEE